MSRPCPRESLPLNLILHLLSYSDSTTLAKHCLTSSKWLYDWLCVNSWCLKNVEFVCQRTIKTKKPFVSTLKIYSICRGVQHIEMKYFTNLKTLTIDEMGDCTCKECHPWKAQIYSNVVISPYTSLSWGSTNVYSTLNSLTLPWRYRFLPEMCQSAFPRLKRLVSVRTYNMDQFDLNRMLDIDYDRWTHCSSVTCLSMPGCRPTHLERWMSPEQIKELDIVNGQSHLMDRAEDRWGRCLSRFTNIVVLRLESYSSFCGVSVFSVLCPTLEILELKGFWANIKGCTFLQLRELYLEGTYMEYRLRAPKLKRLCIMGAFDNMIGYVVHVRKGDLPKLDHLELSGLRPTIFNMLKELPHVTHTFLTTIVY